MKASYFILSVCFALFIAIESKEAVKKYTETLTNGQSGPEACRTTSGVTIEFLENINKTAEELEAPEYEEIRNKIGCYISCLMQQQNVMNKTVIDTNKISNILREAVDSSEEIVQDKIEEAVNLIHDCGKKVENMTDACAVGWKFGTCLGDILGF